MLKLLHFSLCCIAFCSGIFQLTAQPADTAAATRGNTYAVVIGLSQYQNPAIPKLAFADKDATLFASFLQSKAGGSVPAEQVKLLVNEAADIAAIYQAFDWLKEKATKDDLVYIYFSGHGDIETNNTFSLGYLLAYNSPQNNYRNNAIRIEDLDSVANTLSITKKAKVVVISDACHTGKLAGDLYKGKQLVANQLRLVLNNEVRMASCAADELAAEGPDWGGGRGVFSWYLLSGMQGAADLEKDGTVRLRELNRYLDSAFKTDQYLLENKQQQHPVTDGNPDFPLAVVDPATLARLSNADSNNNSTISAGLLAFTAVDRQPIDHFFAVADTAALENMVNFKAYETLEPSAVPLRMIVDCIAFQQRNKRIQDSLKKADLPYDASEFFDLDSLGLLKNQLTRNRSVNTRFNEKFIQLVHKTGQDMINAYLAGDLAELEKRQYYYSGKRQYRNFLVMVQLALNIIPPDHQLTSIIKVQQRYLEGLVDRLAMVTSNKTDSLAKQAMAHQQQALALEPYAAYIHNETGNLYLRNNQYDSAEYHFNLATVLSPTWAIPWSNRIRMNLQLNKIPEANRAIQAADSLQPNLAYVMINAGLVMEKQKNWLRAEGYYLRAIAKNNVHFLPFERLANIYLATGEYAKANQYFHEAATRKKDFTLNEKDFKYGLELGGIGYNSYRPEMDSCSLLALGQDQQGQAFSKMFRALALLGDTTANTTTAIQLLQEAVTQLPGIPLANHYLGKYFIQQRQWLLAEAALRRAIIPNPAGDSLVSQLEKLEQERKSSPVEDCLLNSIRRYQYDMLEDHYLLARVYEEQKKTSEALQQYQEIASIENERQVLQADYVGFPAGVTKAAPKEEKEVYMADELMERYEKPVFMGGAIKAARLLEKLGRFEEAETLLLKQVQQNRAAGDARQKAISAKKNGTWQLLTGSKINFYWLSINWYLEAEVYNFYKQVTQLFPRDGGWKERFGMFLHTRLALAFEQLPIEQYPSFYEHLPEHGYPWIGGENPAQDSMLVFELPGTTEPVNIHLTIYDPLKVSMDNLQQSIRLSGEIQPAPKVLEALADINSWMGNVDEATALYQLVTAMQPRNDSLRYKFLDYLMVTGNLPLAFEQADSLYSQQKIDHDQLLMLANWQILSGRNQDATQVFNKYRSFTDKDKAGVVSLKAKMNWLSGDPAKALTILTAGYPTMSRAAKEKGADNSWFENQPLPAQLYTIARLYAIVKQDDKALPALKTALDKGFNYKNVLENDSAWSRLKATAKWKQLIRKYKLKESEAVMAVPDNNPITFWIPGFKNPQD